METPRPTLLNWLWYGLGRVIQLVIGWQIPGQLPTDPKYIIIAPHTSMIDFVMAWMAVAVLSRGFAGLHFCWLGKQELFHGPLGWLLRLTGGIPVDRSGAHNLVEQSIAAFAKYKRMIMVITPEGQRKRGRRWKTGFYYIAMGANVPILLGRLDYRLKIVSPGMLLWPGGDITADMQQIKEFYQGMTARFPDQVGEIVVPEPGTPPPASDVAEVSS
jgi:1-acyl-sn-glycerol-3-phosphate acyltransferase